MRLFELSATELARAIRAREVSCREVMEAHLARIEQFNAYLGAVTLVLRESALAAADSCDRSEPRGPLHGVPFTVKENIDCLGSATTHGLPLLRNALPYGDAPAVLRLKAAGAIPIARTNLSEMGLRLCSVNPLHGRTLNPYDRKLTVGGSSGGDAAAVATGMAPLGLGGDIGGSLRIPAQCCGVAALKPTTGRIAIASSLEPQDLGPASQAMLALGPLARTVADLRASFAILAGRDVRDPRSVDAPLQGPAPPTLRAGLVTELPGAPLEPNTLDAIQRAGRALMSAGWEVETVTPPELARVNDLFGRLLASDLAIVTRKMQPFISQVLYEHLWRLCQANQPEWSHHRLYTERSRLMRAWSRFFADCPVLVGPNWAHAIWPVDADIDPNAGVDLLKETVRFVTPGNALGLPSLALPMGLRDNLPTSVLVYADLWREDLCLQAAEIIEASVEHVSPIDPRSP
ncbi:MAG: amidase family protein [Myxococcota bacterium]